MKKSCTPLALCLALLALALPGWSQITIERDHFPRQGSFTDTLFRAVAQNIALPSEGPDQVWDYSTLLEEEELLITYTDASNDPDFPGALNYRTNDLSFQGLVIPAVQYERLDDQGWWEAGRVLQDVTYPIQGITGSPNDSLRFVGGVQDFAPRTDLLKFPLNYQDEWTESYTERVNFELTVTGFGLNQVPGYRDRTTTLNRDVVGYGTLTIPGNDGQPSNPIDVLLIKTNRTILDSVFLAGDPAPPTLLAAFGITQGSTFEDTYYNFYRLDYGAYVLNVGALASPNAFYRPAAAEVLTSAKEQPRVSVRTYPNPIKAGQELSLHADSPMDAGFFSLYDLSGRLVHRIQFNSAGNPQVQLAIPAQLSSGMYLYQLHTPQGSPLGAGKLLVE